MSRKKAQDLTTRTECVRLYPNQPQMTTLSFTVDSTRRIYNRCLIQKKDAFTFDLGSITFNQQSFWLTQYRKHNAKIRACNREFQQAALKRLDNGYKYYFERLSDWKANGRLGDKPGPPRKKTKNSWHSITHYHAGRDFKVEKGKIYIPDIGWVKYRNNRALPHAFGTCTIKEINGKW